MRRAEPATTREILQKRVMRLLRMDRQADDPSELRQQILPFIQSLGPALLIGGAIRDVARAGKEAFTSDFDFVVYGCDRGDFITKMNAGRGVLNRFGGYALNCFTQKVDVWHIEDTWARTAGHVAVTRPVDLLGCTFFDWDSVLFDILAMKLMTADDYFDKLTSNIMDIRLQENPNPVGSLVRALRRAALWNVCFGPRLTAFCKQYLEEVPWPELVELDQRAFHKPVLKYLDRDRLLEHLESPRVVRSSLATLPVPARSQLPLTIASETENVSTHP
jgi:hypothetical protein